MNTIPNSTEQRERPCIWILDTEQEALEGAGAILSEWAEAVYYPFPTMPSSDAPQPDAILFSAEIRGGAAGEQFMALAALADTVPLLAVSRLRSLAQAVSFFRAGAADYLAFPLDEAETRERIIAAIDRAASASMHGVMVELEAVDPDPGEITLRLSSSTQDKPSEPNEDLDILAHIPSPEASENGTAETENPLPDQDDPADLDDGEVEPVDGLPIPTLWEELPCGLLVYDSSANLVFSNRLGMELFGTDSLAELQEILEHRRSDFNAYGGNHKPLTDDHWPQDMAWKAGTPKSGIVSIELPNHRRSWLRIDCLPHRSNGIISRLSMTVVNMTGELPPLAIADSQPTSGRTAPKQPRSKRRGKKNRK